MAKWCPKCIDIVSLMNKSGLELKAEVLDDSSGEINRLGEQTGTTDVPAIKIGESILLGYFPRQLSILLKSRFEARNHPAHPLKKRTVDQHLANK